MFYCFVAELFLLLNAFMSQVLVTRQELTVAWDRFSRAEISQTYWQRCQSYDGATFKVTEFFSVTHSLPLFIYGDFMDSYYLPMEINNGGGVHIHLAIYSSCK